MASAEGLRSAHSERLFLLTHPRCGSHLLMKILNMPNQSKVSTRPFGGYFFFPTYLTIYEQLQLYAKPMSSWTEEERVQLQKSLQAGFEELERETMANVGNGKTSLFKEHTCWMADPTSWMRQSMYPDSIDAVPWTVRVPLNEGTAETMPPIRSPNNSSPMPDAYMRQWRPTFLIRHPAFSFPSYRRASDKSNELLQPQMSLRYSRLLYDFYCTQHGKHESQTDNDGTEATDQFALVLSADDVLLRPAVLQRWCRITGLDAEKLQYQWDPVSQEQWEAMPDVARRMMVTISRSNGVQKERSSEGLVLEEEFGKWDVEFGDETGRQLKKWVLAAMDDWEYLNARRLRA